MNDSEIRKSGVYIEDSAKFEQAVNSLEQSYNNIRNICDIEKKNVEVINQTKTWSGTMAQGVYDKYKELNANYDLVTYSLDLYIKFLKKTLEDYKLFEAAQNRNMEYMASNLDVNS